MMRTYFSLSHLVAGFIAVMVGFTSSVMIIFQAATAAGASEIEISSWLFGLGLSIGIPCIILSLYYRMPILLGWSTPGAALLATSLNGVSMPEAIGAFVISALLTIIAGFTGLFEKIIDHIPRSLTSAMLAGILLHFGLDVFSAMQDQFLMVFMMLSTYLIGKRLFPRYVIIVVLITGIIIAKLTGLLDIHNLSFRLSTPVFTLPEFSLGSLISISIPLFVVTMTSQNLPGFVILNAANYHPCVSALTSWTGISTLLFAPFGSYSVSLTALTAAICTSKEADPDPALRYRSSVFAGLCWLLIATFGTTLVVLITAFPKELVIAIAGLALFSTISGSFKTALEDEKQREPAIITILTSASGISLFGIGAAFWGLIAGIIASLILNWRPRQKHLFTTI